MRRVVIVYVMGENSLSSYSSQDLSEIRSATDKIPSDCRLAVFYDNSSTETPKVYSYDPQLGETNLYAYPSAEIITN